MKSAFITYLLTFSIIIIVLYYLNTGDYLNYLTNISLQGLILSCLIALVIYGTSGLQYYFYQKKNKQYFDAQDIVLLPVVSNLWSFIIPFQGSLLFSTLYLKSKYKLNIEKSFSINLYLYIMTVVFAGFTGLLFAWLNDAFWSWFTLISALLFFSPLLLMMFYHFLKKVKPVFRISFLNLITNSIISVSENINHLFFDKKYTLKIILLHITRTLLCVIWFKWISVSLGLEIPYIALLLLSLMMDVSLIIKLTPDNLGFTQLTSGLLMAFAGLEPHIGMLITLMASLSTIIIILTIGIAGNFYIMKNLKIPSLRKMLNKFKELPE